MTVQATQASKEVIDASTNPHKLISLLMAGMLERVEQAQQTIADGNAEDEVILIDKIIAIVHGLRGNLNFEQGGDIAHNLDSLYEYMLERIAATTVTQDSITKIAALTEVQNLMREVKSGWDGVQEMVAA